jgi:hypothetical protein
MKDIVRRLSALEQHRSRTSRKVHFIKATDNADSDRQIAELQASGRVGPRDGFLSLTGRSVSA